MQNMDFYTETFEQHSNRFLLLSFCLCFTACQDYFTHFEQSQSLGGVKTGDPREKPPDHPQAELGLSDYLNSINFETLVRFSIRCLLGKRLQTSHIQNKIY